MNYLIEINAFERWLETNPISANAQLLWYKLMALANRAGWPNWISVDNNRLMILIQASSYNTAIRARDVLVDAGLIEYQKGKKSKPNRYRIISFESSSISEENKDTLQNMNGKRKCKRIENESKNGQKTKVETNVIYKHKLKPNINNAAEDSNVQVVSVDADSTKLNAVAEAVEKELHLIASGSVQGQVELWLDEWSDERIILRAISEAALNNARSAKYVDAILRSWKSKGLTTLSAIECEIASFNERKANGSTKPLANAFVSEEGYRDLSYLEE